MRAWSKTSALTMWLVVAALEAGCSADGSAGSGDFVQGGGSNSSAPHGDAGAGVTLGNGTASDAGAPANGDDASLPGRGGDDASTRGDGATASDASGGVDSAPPVVTADSAPPVTPVDSGDPLAAARAQCVQIINQYRATLSPPSPPLTESTTKETCVDGQAQADYTANTAHSAFGQCSEFAQDECPGWPGPPSSINTDCLAQMWAEGPPAAGQDNHWLNMSNAKYTKVACGFYQTPSGDWWTTQDFW